MAADETTGAPDDTAAHRDMLRHARDHCRRLIDDLRRDAAHLAAQRPSPLVPENVLAEGRLRYAQTAAAAEALLHQLDQSPHDGSPTTPSRPDPQ